jgi:hypothetical protein
VRADAGDVAGELARPFRLDERPGLALRRRLHAHVPQADSRDPPGPDVDGQPEVEPLAEGVVEGADLLVGCIVLKT